MKKSLLYGIFLFVSGISLIITSLNNEHISYAYQEEINNGIIFKYDALNHNNETGYFQIVDEEYNIIKSFELKLGDKITINKLNNQRYILRQLKAPDNYNYIEDIYFKPQESFKEVLLTTIKSTKSKIAISSMDIKSNTFLSGAEFHLMDKHNNIINSCTTLTGYCYMMDIDPGEYVIENVIASDGYVISDNKEIIINELNTYYVDMYTNKTILHINSYGEYGNLLSEVTYKLYDSTYKEIAIINNNLFEGIKAGTYYLENISVPPGISKRDSKLTIEISDNNTPKTINVYYDFIKEKPLLRYTILMGGSLLFISGIALLIIYYKNHYLVNTNNR